MAQKGPVAHQTHGKVAPSLNDEGPKHLQESEQSLNLSSGLRPTPISAHDVATATPSHPLASDLVFDNNPSIRQLSSRSMESSKIVPEGQINLDNAFA